MIHGSLAHLNRKDQVNMQHATREDEKKILYNLTKIAN